MKVRRPRQLAHSNGASLPHDMLPGIVDAPHASSTGWPAPAEFAAQPEQRR